MKESEVDFKFKVSPAEQRIIELRPDPPSSIILLGRSGTGKTTCAVFRMFGRWLYAHNKGEADNMVGLNTPSLLLDSASQAYSVMILQPAACCRYSLHAVHDHMGSATQP